MAHIGWRDKGMGREGIGWRERKWGIGRERVDTMDFIGPYFIGILGLHVTNPKVV